MVDQLAPWRSPLSRALHRNRSLPYARYFQLATVQPDGKPSNRTVVFRGFSESGCVQVVTDQRSEKIADIHAHPWGEICWYFPKTREQFRILGSIRVVSHESTDDQLVATRQELWQKLSDNARQQFVWPLPGHPRDHQSAFDVDSPPATHPVPHFSVLLLEPSYVDHLELKGNPQDRHIYQLSSDHTQWTTQVVNP
jgi:PPOX class probable FMN-dependent enzyme